MEETWKLCIGLEATYKVSTLGNIRHINSEKNRKIYFGKSTNKGKARGIVSINVNGKQKIFHIHRLIALTFLPNPNNYPQVNHIDGDSSNNTLINLEWCNQSQNMKHAYKIGLHTQPQKFTLENLTKLLNGLNSGFNQYEMSRAFNVDPSIISDIVNGNTYKTCGIDFSKFSKSYYTNIARNNINSIQALYKSGISAMKIANQYNVSDTFVKNLIEMI
jgi:hypothetical protein